ncbi:MAG: hypothetical protein IPJ60_07490 [Sphingobacteriaceae bacterium]|nr:hypothetical protein [Sphingobacteriaceae bacterium]
MKKIILASLITIAFIACKKDPVEPEPTPTPQPTTGSMKIEFEPKVGDSALVFDTKKYVNVNTDTFKVNIFRYYVSNIVLTKSDNSTYSVPNSYYKVNHNVVGKNVFTMSGIPIANYKAIQFMIGVDSTRNVSGAQSGDLAVSDMFWSWSTGYIFAKLEATSPQSSAGGQTVTFHVGGFTTPNNSIRTANISFGSSTANVTAGTTPEVHLKSDLAKWFFGAGGTVTFATMNTIMSPGANAKKIADNYAQSFSFEHVHN